MFYLHTAILFAGQEWQLPDPGAATSRQPGERLCQRWRSHSHAHAGGLRPLLLLHALLHGRPFRPPCKVPQGMMSPEVRLVIFSWVNSLCQNQNIFYSCWREEMTVLAQVTSDFIKSLTLFGCLILSFCVVLSWYFIGYYQAEENVHGEIWALVVFIYSTSQPQALLIWFELERTSDLAFLWSDSDAHNCCEEPLAMILVGEIRTL